MHRLPLGKHAAITNRTRIQATVNDIQMLLNANHSNGHGARQRSKSRHSVALEEPEDFRGSVNSPHSPIATIHGNAVRN